ncbi:MAG: transcription-repair coupling factor [Clostridiales bacterium]|nr:transcription-repair coupling factor [Clostridiales bacterium]
MPKLCDFILQIPELSSILNKINLSHAPYSLISGVQPVHKAHIIAALVRNSGKKSIVICSDESSCARLCSDINSFLDTEISVLLPTRDFVFRNVEAVSREWEQKRLAALYGFLTGKYHILLASAEAIMERTLPPDMLLSSALLLKRSEKYSLDHLVTKLLDAGYRRSFSVEGTGQFAVRGGILDVYSPGESGPIRAEFFGDEIDSLSFFDIDSQRRTEELKEALILPAFETLPSCSKDGVTGLISTIQDIIHSKSASKNPAAVKTLEQDIERLQSEGIFPAIDRLMCMIYPDFVSAIDYAPHDSIVILDDYNRIKQSAKSCTKRVNEDLYSLLSDGLISSKHSDFWLDYTGLSEKITAHTTVILDAFPAGSYDKPIKTVVNLTAKQLPSFSGSLDSLISDISHYQATDFSVFVLASSRSTAMHLKEILESDNIPAALDFDDPPIPEKSKILITTKKLSAGFEYPAIKLAVIAEGSIAAANSAKQKRPKKRSAQERIRSYSDLVPGDLIVHEHHGIGRFSGIERMTVDGYERDYIKLAFAGTDYLYLPASSLDLISKYIGGGGEDAPVRLNKLGGSEWQKAKLKAKGAAKDLAKKLIQLYAERQKLEGIAFPKDDNWQREFEEAFQYDETDDQLRCASEIKEDMQKSYPMDRLLCGDVGFGKTEVAFRAVMKCALGGKQAAILVPTTVLARQHYLTALHRFEGYPVKIEMLSRFSTSKELKKSLLRLKNGSADLCIGTHRLLQKDVEFHDLGLLIIDEEQRFGVTHKERLKEIAHKIDVLTLTATPIPRTLNMALSGIRDMSVLEEAPRDRYPVQTYVLEHDHPFLCDAMRRELSRGGQVYYLHNHIESISRTAAKLRGEFPDSVVEIAHGQMPQHQLSEIMGRMSDGNIDILVCTTIIETVLDISNVNTLIIENADTFGLSQLHQIRGRVGRSSRHAFAYFTYRRGKVLSEIAQKRLSAIREFAEFGSGFKIAMRDLEIRGAGNVLGPEQSGHMMSVGYDMYLKLLEEAVITEQGGEIHERVECSADFSLNANIPEKYINDSGQRIDFYRRIAMIKCEDDREDLIDELIDRFGDPPAETIALLDIALLRFEAGEAGIIELSQKSGCLIIVLKKPDFMKISLLCSEEYYKGRVLLNAGEHPYLSLRLKADSSPIKEARRFIADYHQAAPIKE